MCAGRVACTAEAATDVMADTMLNVGNVTAMVTTGGCVNACTNGAIMNVWMAKLLNPCVVANGGVMTVTMSNGTSEILRVGGTEGAVKATTMSNAVKFTEMVLLA